ncbi:hypothetical protein Acr_08g0013750 [Actinidia rufa]|uniref:Uncharacterized protein n=1 Tax=Actinidia rufa TaxID=165716 RepID=A0A7J0F409_9ERIC|nr:hypothetical protein Acr_08g0013750 [Actinidia rufa]
MVKKLNSRDLLALNVKQMRRGEIFIQESLGAHLVTECPLGAGAGNLVISPAEELIVGSISGGNSLINIWKSPLLRQFGVMESEINFARTDLIDTTKSALLVQHQFIT